MQEKTGACRRCKAACFAWQVFCGAACSALWEMGDRDVDLRLDEKGELKMLDGRAAVLIGTAELIHGSIDPTLCEHANECPAQCPCDEWCYCKSHTCKSKGAV